MTPRTAKTMETQRDYWMVDPDDLPLPDAVTIALQCFDSQDVGRDLERFQVWIGREENRDAHVGAEGFDLVGAVRKFVAENLAN